MLMENVRYSLYQFKPQASLYIDEHIMSKTALRYLVEQIFTKETEACDMTANTVGLLTGMKKYSVIEMV